MYAISNDYKDVIYSGQASHRLELLFNSVEYPNANIKTESVKVTSNILSNGQNRFSLDNFVSKTAEIVIHDIDIADIIEPISISIGTLVDNSYEYVPMGMFLIDETPTTDKGKTTIKLRDFSSKFDVTYNAETIITQSGGSVTMAALLQDICNYCGVTNNVGSFPNDDTEISVWDNTVTARQYIMYIAEKAGRIATMDRTGTLIFVDINNQTPVELPVNVISSYQEGEKLEISRVVYEDAVRKFEYGTEDESTLYINSSNPYIVDTSEIENIYDEIDGFSIYSMKIDKMIGNPALDPYDIITFEYNNTTYYTFAQNVLTYNGVIMQTFDTQIGTKEKSEENVTLNTEDTRYKRVNTRLDQAEGIIELNTSEITDIKDDLESNYYTVAQTNTLVQSAATGITNTFSEAGGNNIFRNTGLWFANSENDSQQNPYEFWNGVVAKESSEKAANGNALKLKATTLYQQQNVPNGNYTVSFKYKKLLPLSSVSVIINGVTYTLGNTPDTEFVTGQDNIQALIVTSQTIKVQFVSDTDDSCLIYDLMVNAGGVKLAYSQNQNETTTDTVNISKGITITSSNTETTFKANSDGIRTLDNNGNELAKFTDKGMNTKEMVVREKGEISGLLIQEIGNQTWLTKI